MWIKCLLRLKAFFLSLFIIEPLCFFYVLNSNYLLCIFPLFQIYHFSSVFLSYLSINPSIYLSMPLSVYLYFRNMSLKLCLEFSGGAELLFNNQKKHSVSIPTKEKPFKIQVRSNIILIYMQFNQVSSNIKLIYTI